MYPMLRDGVSLGSIYYEDIVLLECSEEWSAYGFNPKLNVVLNYLKAQTGICFIVLAPEKKNSKYGNAFFAEFTRCKIWMKIEIRTLDVSHYISLFRDLAWEHGFKVPEPVAQKFADHLKKRKETDLDSVLIVPTKRTTIKKGAEVLDKEAVRNEIFYQNVLGFLSVMNERVDAEGICLDPADVNAIFKNAGLVHMGVGRASGRNKAERAVKEVIEDSLPENALDTARRVLVQITGSEDVKLEEIESVVMQVVKNTHPEVTMLFGASFDKDFEDELYITVFASEFDA